MSKSSASSAVQSSAPPSAQPSSKAHPPAGHSAAAHSVHSHGSHAPVLLSARGVVKTYHDGDRILEVLRGIDLALRRGETAAIIGSSGAGKSTLLHILGALDLPSSGDIELLGSNYSKLSENSLADLRARSVGFIYQFHHLLPEFSALENVLAPGLILRTPYGVMLDRAAHLLEAVGLKDRMTHRPARLSGGEQQRVALARALMNNPDLVLADEPTGNLDQETGRMVMDLIWNQTAGQGKSLVIVTHDPVIAHRAHRVFKLDQGRLKSERSE